MTLGLRHFACVRKISSKPNRHLKQKARPKTEVDNICYNDPVRIKYTCKRNELLFFLEVGFVVFGLFGGETADYGSPEGTCSCF